METKVYIICMLHCSWENFRKRDKYYEQYGKETLRKVSVMSLFSVRVWSIRIKRNLCTV